jgi:hypothetical protein
VAGSGPILAPNSYLQFPGRVQPRSMAWAARRRAVLLTDGAIYKKEVPGLLPLRLLSKWEPVPQAYVVDGATGNTTYTMQFTSRRTPALPYGIAEDPRDGRVAVTFYQAQSDSIEVWQPDLSWKYTYHDVSLKPCVTTTHEQLLLLRGGGLLGSKVARVPTGQAATVEARCCPLTAAAHPPTHATRLCYPHTFCRAGLSPSSTAPAASCGCPSPWPTASWKRVSVLLQQQQWRRRQIHQFPLRPWLSPGVCHRHAGAAPHAVLARPRTGW